MIVKVQTEHHFECLSLKEGCRGSSESTHIKMLHVGHKQKAPNQIGRCSTPVEYKEII